MTQFQMFLMSNPENTLRIARALIFALLLIVSLAMPEVAFANPVGGDVGS